MGCLAITLAIDSGPHGRVSATFRVRYRYERELAAGSGPAEPATAEPYSVELVSVFRGGELLAIDEIAEREYESWASNNHYAQKRIEEAVWREIREMASISREEWNGG